MLDMLAVDLRYALRIFRRSPGLAATAVVSLAVGTSAATGLFSIVNAALLNPFPFADINSAPGCGFKYNVTWSVVQACFAADTTLSVFIVADAYGIYHLIDGITVNGKTFTSASDNGGGNNDPAGPLATTDLSLLPPVLPLPQPQ